MTQSQDSFSPLQQRLQMIHGMLGDGRPRDALQLARGLVNDMPGWADAQCALGVAAVQCGDDATAHQAFEAAVSADPSHVPALKNLALFLRERGFPHQAMGPALRGTQAAPADVEAWMELGWCARDAHRRAGAAHAFGEATRLQPDNDMARHALSQAQAELQQFEMAEATLDALVEKRRGDPALTAEKAMRRRQQGKSAEALALLDLSPPEARDHPLMRDVRAGVLADLDHTRHALADAQELVRMHPDFTPGLQTLAHLEWEYGLGIDAATQVFDRACDAQPESPGPAFARINFLQASRQHERALERLSQLRAFGVEDADIAHLRAFSLDERGDHDEAHRLYAIAEPTQGRDPMFLNLWARNRLRMRDAKAAEALAQRALVLDNESQEALAYLATAWRLQDDPRELQLCSYDQLIGFVDIPEMTAEDFDVLAKVLDTLHQAQREPVHQSVRGGSQTTGRLFASHRPDAVRAMQPRLAQAVEAWLAQLPFDPKHPFLKRNTGRINITGSWSVRLRRSGNHVNHIHNEGWISSALYVALPPAVRAADNGHHAGWIQFGQPPVELGLDLPPRRIIQPQVGKLALFPSYMWHGTVPFEDDAPRMTIAFDMVPKP